MKPIMKIQSVLLLAFFIGIFLPFIGNYLTNKIRIENLKYRPSHENRISWKWNYFYAHLLINLIWGIFKPATLWLADYVPKTPIVYIYGKDKPY